MSLKVEFEFKPRDMVKTPLGDEGIVTMAGVPMDHPEPQYFVKTKTGGAWWTADQLKLVEPCEAQISRDFNE